MYKRMAIFLSLFILVTLACSIGGSPFSQAPGGNNPAGTPPANPVSINDGLASLNSYQMTIMINSTGPDPAQSSNTTVNIQRDKNTRSSVTHSYGNSVKPGSDPTNSDTYLYRIGNDRCSGTEGDWSWTSMPANQAEMLDIITGMYGLTPLIDAPTFVAQETVNGISSNHFTFKVTGLGVQTGAEVTANQGDYWLAVDGQYIVKYVLRMGTSMNPQTDVLYEEISIELTQVNQPVSIAFPQGCLDASLVTPTP